MTMATRFRESGAAPAERLRIAALYRLVPYLADGVPIRIGRRSPAMDALLAAHGVREGVLVTAWNPGGRRRPAALNRLSAARLDERLRRFRTLPGVNGELRWREESLLVLGAGRRAERLGRLFGQRAVVLLRRGQRARILFLR